MRILVLTGMFGNGHKSAADAVKDELEHKYEDADVVIVDLFAYILRIFSRPVYKLFNIIASKYHGLYNAMDKVDEDVKGTPLEKAFNYRFDKLIREYSPDVLVSTWPVGAKYVGDYIKKKNNAIPYIICITDIQTNNAWISDSSDAYIVGDETTGQELVGKGVDPEKIYVGGIPVRKEFKSMERKTTNKNIKEVLVMGGGLGLIPGAADMLKYLSAEPDVHTTVITGENRELFDKLNGKYENVDVLGYCNDVYRYMAKSDMLISKAGGVTLFEAIYSETPMLVIDPFLSQEKTNAMYIERKNIGKVLHNGDDIEACLESMLNGSSEIMKMRNNMRCIKNKISGHGLPEAIEEIRKNA
jgi:UDP-N-acetylglucosamine:LPS N-acetylglucosamine transferase